VTALLLGGNFDLGSILAGSPLADAVCASSVCVKACRDLCHALTVSRLGQIFEKMPPGKTDDELAATIYDPDVVLQVSPIAVLGSAKIALEYLTVRGAGGCGCVLPHKV
jgi:hypothetical protein